MWVLFSWGMQDILVAAYEIFFVETFVLSWIELKHSKQAPPCKLTTGTPPGSTLCLSRSQFSDLQKPAVWVLSGSILQAFCYDPRISHTSLASHARGLLLSLHFLEKDLHLKHTLWCDWRITTHRKKYKTSLYIDWLMKMLWPEAHRSLTLYFP